jgi:hypothetical protein
VRSPFACPRQPAKRLEAYLDCGLLCRGFARLRCGSCRESRLVAFSCKGRGFCPSCLGRHMCATAANLVERVLPEVALRQWVLTFPFAWRPKLARDGALLSALTRIFVEAVLAFYGARANPFALAGAVAKSGAVTVVQRTSSDLRLNPHLHAVFLDGAYREEGETLAWKPLGHLQTREVGAVLEKAIRRMAKYLQRRQALALADTGTDNADGAGDDGDDNPEGRLETSAVTGQTPPCGPQWLRGLAPLAPHAMAYDKPLCASLDGFTLHAATNAGAADLAGREALLRYVLRPPIAQERVESKSDGLVRLTLKRAFADGTVAVEMDPLSLLSRLAASVPPPRYHIVKYAGVLASASKLRSRIGPRPPNASTQPDADGEPPVERPPRSTYRPWAELLRRTFAIDALECPKCQGRMHLLAIVTEPRQVRRFLAEIGEPTEPPARSPNRGPPYWQSTVLRRSTLGDAA